MFVPYSDIIAAALQTQSSNFASIGWGHVGNDTTNHDVLDGFAIRARHSGYLLTEQSTSVIYLGFIATSLTAIFQFPSHRLLFLPFNPVLQSIIAFYSKNSKASILAGLGQTEQYCP